MPSISADIRVQRVVDFFESLTPQTIARIPVFYSEDAYFKDPFNEVRGLTEIQLIFQHMYDALHEPHFVVTNTIAQGDECFIVWDFKFRFKRFNAMRPQIVRGCSHVHFAIDGRIMSHRDYWDAAEELYEKLPVLGSFMRFLKRRANS